MADEYKDKLRTTILTDAGRQTFLQVGYGTGTLVYTRAVLSSQSMNDSNGTPLANEIIASYNNLSDDLKDGKLQLSPVTGNHFEVIANFDNKNQQRDISFSAIGWYARIDTQNVNGGSEAGNHSCGHSGKGAYRYRLCVYVNSHSACCMRYCVYGVLYLKLRCSEELCVIYALFGRLGDSRHCLYRKNRVFARSGFSGKHYGACSVVNGVCNV